MPTDPSQMKKYLKNLKVISKWGGFALGFLGMGGYIPFILSLCLMNFIDYTVISISISIVVFGVSANFFNYLAIAYYRPSFREGLIIMLIQNIGILSISFVLFYILFGILTNPDRPL
jgi:uncharacterized membrane protein YfcA